MNRMSLIVLMCLTGLWCSGQYYYNDIVAAQLSQKQYLVLKNNHVRNVTALSYESDNELSEDFKLDQQISADAKTIKIFSSYPSSGNTVTINNYSDNKLIKTVDSTTNVVNTINYSYDTEGKIISIVTVTEDTFMKSHSEEMHQWFYNKIQPSYMLRIRDKTDTTLVAFSYDDQGNVAQEDWKKKGKVIETYYYYYNNANQLTDIVRFNIRAKKMLPDFLFEYDNINNLSQLTEIPAGSNDYMVWKYAYTDEGLKKTEYLFNKQKQVVGRIEYKYQ